MEKESIIGYKCIESHINFDFNEIYTDLNCACCGVTSMFYLYPYELLKFKITENEPNIKLDRDYHYLQIEAFGVENDKLLGYVFEKMKILRHITLDDILELTPNYIKKTNGDEIWLKNGLPHRDENDLPAVIESTGNYGTTQKWCRNGKLFREGGLPTVVTKSIHVPRPSYNLARVTLGMAAIYPHFNY
jgi:hypothetical protein